LGRGLRKEIVERNFPDLPQDFVEWRKRRGKHISLERDDWLDQLVEEFEEYQRERGQRT